jgi:hypothetical protein
MNPNSKINQLLFLGMIGVHKHVIYHHGIISHQPKHILTSLISEFNFTQNPKVYLTILAQINRWILFKLKTFVKKHDQNIMALTDLKNNDWIIRLIKGRGLVW